MPLEKIPLKENNTLRGFKYSPQTGNIYRNFTTRSKENAGVITRKNRGYLCFSFAKKHYLCHRAAFLLMGFDVSKIPMIDHVNGIRSDNRLTNLRICDSRLNQNNRHTHRKGKLVGASLTTRTGTFRSQIEIEGRSVDLGYFKTEVEAHTMYASAIKHVLGEEYHEEIQSYIAGRQAIIAERGIWFDRKKKRFFVYNTNKGKPTLLGAFKTRKAAEQMKRDAEEQK